jgi:hypothetical protein
VSTGGTGIYGNSNMTFNETTLVLNANQNMCNKTMSNVNSVNMSYVAPFAPTSVGNCVLWLDGSDITTMSLTGSNLTAWRDKSSNNYTASNFGTPVYAANIKNSLGVVQFGTSGFGVSIPSFVLSPRMSVFMVQYPLGATSGPTIEHSSNSDLYPGFSVESGISNFLIRTSIPPPAGLTLSNSGTGIVGAWTAYSGASSYTYTLYSNSIYSYTGGTLVTSASPTSNTFTYASPVSGTYYYYTLNVTTAYGTSTLATSPIGQYVLNAISYVASNAVVTQLRDSGGNVITGSQRGLFELSNGNIIWGDANRVRMITPAGVVSVLAGSVANTGGSNDGIGTAATFSNISSVAQLPNGLVVVGDENNYRIRLIDLTTLQVSTLAGSTQGFADGTGANARFWFPGRFGVVTSNIVVGDGGSNNRLRLITSSTYAANSGVVTTLAGSGTATFADGTGAGASFSDARGVTYDPTTSNIFVADGGNNRVRVVTYPGGVVTTLAGQATAGSSNGTGAAARFNGLGGVVFIPSSAAGPVIVAAEGTNCLIRLVTYPGGVVTTLAGGGAGIGSPGLIDGTGTAAAFSYVSDLAVLSNGNILVGDVYNGRIRLISFPRGPLAPTSPTLSISAGTASMAWTAASGATGYTWTLYQQASNVSTYNGSLVTSGSGSVSAPTVSASLGGLVIGSNYYYTVYASNASGTSPVASSPIVQYIPNPYNLTLNVSSSNATMSWSSTGTSPTFYYTLTQTTAYSYTSGTTTTIATSNTTASSVTPTFTAVSGNFYYYSIYQVTSVGTSPLYVSPIVGYVTPATISYVASNAVVTQLRDSGGNAIVFNAPRGVVQLSNGNIVVAEPAANRIRMITPEGVVSVLAGSGSAGSNDGTGTAATFNSPQGIAVIPSSGLLAVAEFNNNRIRLINPSSGVVTTLAGSGAAAFADGTGAAASFNGPFAVGVIPSTGVILVGDAGNNRIRLVTPEGVVTTLAGNNSAAFGDGTGAAASFNYPIGVAYDPITSNVFVADAGNNRMRAVTYPGGVVTTLAGSGSPAFTDATGVSASFNGLFSISLIPSRNLIVTGDGNNHRIRLVTYPGGAVTTLAGSGTNALTDGTGTAAAFYNPSATAILSNGNILVTDFLNNRVRLITIASLAAPTSPTLSITTGTATLGWTAASGATAYNWILYRSTTSNYNGTSNTSGSTSTTAPTSAPTGLSSGNFWYFTVVSSNASGVSSAIASSIVSY